MNHRLRVAIVGLGAAGRRRATAILALPELYELVAVCDLRGVDESYGVPVFHDHRQLLASETAIDVIVVCTTNDVTCEVVKDALVAGKHVFCEKPAGRSLRETEDIAEVARASPGRIAFGFNHRHHANARQALEIARSGELGRLIFARGVYGKSTLTGWRSDASVCGGGIFLDQGIHLLDLLRQFCGELVEVQAMAGTPLWSAGVEDNIFAMLRAEGGAVASLHSSATQWRHSFELELSFSEGSLLLDGLVTGSGSYLAATGEAETLTVRRGRQAQSTRSTFTEDDSWERELAAYAAVVSGGSGVDVCGVDEAMEVMRLVDSVYDAALVVGNQQAASGRQTDIDLPGDAISRYRTRLGQVMTTAAWDKLEELSQKCLAAHDRGRTIWVAGNGGSAATAAHWVADLRQAFPGARGPRAIALGQNIAYLTASANDRGYDGVFTEEIRDSLHEGDVVVVISASGNSSNILHLLEHAAEHRALTVAVVGFDGGRAAKIAQLSVNTPSNIDDYGPVEDIHMALGHALRERVAELAEQRNDLGAVTA